MAEEKKLTGYPSIDKPWLKYYNKEDINYEFPKCNYVDYIWECNKNRLSENAIDYLGTKITFSELFSQVDQAAKSLLAIGVKAGDCVTIFSVNTPETIMIVFALNKIGAVACLEYVTESPQEAIKAVNHYNSRVVVVLDSLVSRFADMADIEIVQHVIVLPLTRSMPALKKVVMSIKSKTIHCLNEMLYDELLERGDDISLSPWSFCKDSPAVVVHSGGTTGVPKNVVLSNENIIYVAWALKVGCIDATPGDTYYSCIPIFHAFGFVAGLITPFVFKNTLALAVKYDELSFIEDFIRIRPNQSMSSSTYLPALISDPRLQKMNLSFYKNMGMGGTPLSHSAEESLDSFMKNHNSIARPSIGYGMSEIASAACSEMNYYYGKVGSVGIPLCKTSIKVVDTNNTELAYNQEGELYISSPGLMLGYFRDDKTTEESLATDNDGHTWIKTGDLGYIDEDGFVFITGRLKRIYTTRTDAQGAIFHIFPDYIADTICNVDSVKDCAVVCIPDPVLKSIPIAFITSEQKSSDVVEDVITYCEKMLPEHSRPKTIHVIEQIPHTIAGKIDYLTLEKLAEEQING